MAAAPLYDDDLAHVHVAGYGFHWRGAAPAVLRRFHDAGIASGTVIDLGCGGGEWLACLREHGYQAVGVDASQAMIRAARRAAPSAKFIRGSFADVELPSCMAATSLGEPLNYLDGARSIQRTLKNVYKALCPGGLFVFDVRLPATKPVETRVSARVGEDWACISLIDEYPQTNRLVRRITTFRRAGADYRRREEVHELHLYSKRQIAGWLRNLGFRVRVTRGYDDYRLGPRQVVFTARKTD